MRGLVALGAAIGLTAAGEAAASGGLSCETDDASIRLYIESGVTHGMGSPVFQFRASAEIVSGDISADLRQTNFDQSHLAQYWLGDEELKMVLYREREGDKPHGYVEIVVRTASREEGSFSGTYELSVYDDTGDPKAGPKELKVTNDLSCFVE